jgi:phosphoglycolate phosphatase
LGWDNHFGPVIGAGDASADKPDPAPILMALKQLGFPPGPTVWYLGDTALDMVAARAAGVTSVLVGNASHDGGVDRAAPDLHVESTHALATWLKSLA